MEKKTIGNFIAALRRANGMTQKELAERLNVSDKTVSRWECDDGAPDISLIPVIAEIFGVSCDELLRGERKSASNPPTAPETTESTYKGEKQRKRLFAAGLSRYQTLTWISAGISIGGLLAAMVTNFGFLRAYIGFFIGAACYLVSVICQALGINRAFLSVSDDDLDTAEVGLFKYAVVHSAEYSFGLTAVLLGGILPLVLLPGDAYVGLSGETFFLYGLLCAAIALVIYAFGCYFANDAMLRHGVYMMSDKKATAYHHNHKLKKRCFLVLIPLLVVTFILHLATTEIWGPRSIMKGTTFDDYESFAAYMEQDIPYYHFDDSTVAVEPLDGIYYDKDGNEISKDEALRRTLTLHDGTVVYEYLNRNQSVCAIRYSEQNGSLLPITVCTYHDLQVAQANVAMRHILFAFVYMLETITALGVYIRKRAK